LQKMLSNYPTKLTTYQELNIIGNMSVEIAIHKNKWQ
jgi:hypothetical protein